MPDKAERGKVGLRIITRRSSIDADALKLKGLCLLRMGKGKDFSDVSKMSIGSYQGKGELSPIYGRVSGGRGLPFIRGYRISSYEIRISFEDAFSMDMQNKLFLFYDGEEISSINYAFSPGRAETYRNTRIIRKQGRTMFFRQTVNNRMWFTVRPEIMYDRPAQRLRLWLAWLISKATPPSDTILMYEKEASRYEESASVLFEKLIEEGYENVRFIIDEGNPSIEKIPPECRNHLIYRDSFRHLLEFFRCRTFIASETMDHSLRLRIADKHVARKLRSRDLNYVFLQHGVMYMVSLDADVRVGFRPGERRKDRTVVSSEVEARHFIDLAGFLPENLYVTGLAKFDRSYRSDDADLIMIMPTWRRWESNEAHRDFENTGYYRMLERMVDAVPDDLLDKVVIMPHPLMREMMNKAHTRLEKYMRPNMSHDEVLRHTRLLITDYSSIAYDAFYRGANVIFCWEDRDECMENYGGAHLMLNEENAFGDVTYSAQEREAAVIENYRMEQSAEYREKYGRRVEFHDGHNTDRIIEKLKEDMII